jgi:IMP dehydrogenase/GMP reductase
MLTIVQDALTFDDVLLLPAFDQAGKANTLMCAIII